MLPVHDHCLVVGSNKELLVGQSVDMAESVVGQSLNEEIG
jgi:hypothetical protein